MGIEDRLRVLSRMLRDEGAFEDYMAGLRRIEDGMMLIDALREYADICRLAPMSHIPTTFLSATDRDAAVRFLECLAEHVSPDVCGTVGELAAIAAHAQSRRVKLPSWAWLTNVAIAAGHEPTWTSATPALLDELYRLGTLPAVRDAGYADVLQQWYTYVSDFARASAQIGGR